MFKNLFLSNVNKYYFNTLLFNKKMRKLLFILLQLLSLQSFAQLIKVIGRVKEASNSNALENASVFISNKINTKTNDKGEFTLTVPKGNYSLIVSSIGFKKLVYAVEVTDNMKEIEILLTSSSTLLKQVTISGSRFEKRAAEEIVSIEIIKPKDILNAGINQVDDALNRVPGVDVVDNQVNIRGGSGWSYGAGSRVLIMVDDMPMLTADAGDAKFDFLPLENGEQIEILKGDASALYGSSALNGIVNFRTGYAKSKPVTKLMLYNGLFGNPKRLETKWWGKQQPQFQGGYFLHAQKFNRLDAVIGGAWFSEDSYLQGDLTRRARVNVNLRYRFKKIDGLVAGLNTNIQKSKAQTFFFWAVDTINLNRVLQAFGGLNDSTTTINKNQGSRFNIDPFITYSKRNNTKHSLRSRFFRSNNQIPEKKQTSIADIYYADYQFQKSLKKELNIIVGATGTKQHVTGELYGNHDGFNIATYAQVDKKINKLWVSSGIRYEINKIDDYKIEARPVARIGANYEAGQATFIRGSFGQGYRYPTIAERFVRTDFGASKVLPNLELNSETGWSAELGAKQGYKIGKWIGYGDVALFWTEYRRMMEFQFGLHIPKDSNANSVRDIYTVKEVADYFGFQSKNIGNTRIYGIDASIVGMNKINETTSLKFMLAYTNINPTQINPDSAIKVNLSGTTNTLKYRYRHSAKFDGELVYKKIILGTTCLYNSFMQNIDAVFANERPQEFWYWRLIYIGTKT
jgi:iron complex outermembrane receptor protein